MEIVDTPPAEDCTLRERKKRQTRQTIHEVALRLITERGPSSVTIDEICAGADVSQRTFFNYYPSKAAAAVGLTEFVLDDAERQRFLAAPDHDLIDDLCRLIASAIDSPVDRVAVKTMMGLWPELIPTLQNGMSSLRTEIVGLAAQRTGERTAQLAVTLVMAGFMIAVQADRSPGAVLADRIRSAVADMLALAADFTSAAA